MRKVLTCVLEYVIRTKSDNVLMHTSTKVHCKICRNVSIIKNIMSSNIPVRMNESVVRTKLTYISSHGFDSSPKLMRESG